MSGSSDGSALWIAIGFIGTALIGGFIALGVLYGPDFLVPATIVLAIAATLILRGPLGRALAHRIESGVGGPDPELAAETTAELGEIRARVGELEERLDFAERLLAQTREQEPERLREGS